MSNQQQPCKRSDMGYSRLCSTVGALLPLYTDDGSDRADSVLDSYPNPTHIIEALEILIDVMLPGKMSPGHIGPDDLGIFLMRRLSHAHRLLRAEVERAIPFRWIGQAAKTEEAKPSKEDIHQTSKAVLNEFYDTLPEVRKLLIEDIQAAYEGDPAALTYAEVQLAYPGLLAITSHRLAHELYRLNVPIVPRIMSEWTHSHTGIDINPGATIGKGLFLDHGTGIVIGETAEIGDHVKIYQGVTIGAKSFPLDEQGRPIKHIKRHPTVEDNVIIYANATILGGDTVIGANSTVAGNVFLMKSVPADSFVIHRRSELQIKTRQTEAPPDWSI